MATMQELRTQAKAAGVPTSEIRSAESTEELQGLIAAAGNYGDERRTTVVAKKKVAKKTVTKRKPGRPKGSVSKTKAPVKPGRPAIKRGPGRPKGSTNKPKTTARKAAPKTTTRKSTNGRVRNVQSTDGRHILSGIDYRETDGWNPRVDSAPEIILNALRRFKGDREKVFNHLKPRVWDFVGRKMQNGTKRNLASAHAMLQYRIARTDWDFAMKTGQHEASENRIEYGTGPNTTVWKPARKSKAAKKAPAAAPKRRGRPPGSKTAQGTPKRRGRPPGSKNKPKATAARKPAVATRRATSAKRMQKRR